MGGLLRHVCTPPPGRHGVGRPLSPGRQGPRRLSGHLLALSRRPGRLVHLSLRLSSTSLLPRLPLSCLTAFLSRTGATSLTPTRAWPASRGLGGLFSLWEGLPLSVLSLASHRISLGRL